MGSNNKTITDCRDPEGITVGLVDALISIARILAGRDLKGSEVREALKDLADDEDMAKVLQAGKEYKKRKLPD